MTSNGCIVMGSLFPELGAVTSVSLCDPNWTMAYKRFIKAKQARLITLYVRAHTKIVNKKEVQVPPQKLIVKFKADPGTIKKMLGKPMEEKYLA